METPKPKITWKNIGYFIEGHSKWIWDKLVGLPKHVQEQIKYRVSLCPDCIEAGKCKYCGCTAEKKIMVTTSCNGGKRFPDLMNEHDWEDFKKDKKWQTD